MYLTLQITCICDSVKSLLIQMNELTSAIDDKKLVPHFNEVLDPYILQNQMQLNKSLGTPLLNQRHCRHSCTQKHKY